MIVQGSDGLAISLRVCMTNFIYQKSNAFPRGQTGFSRGWLGIAKAALTL